MIRVFSGTLTYQFFDTSYIALQQNFAESVNVGLFLRCKTPVCSKPMARPLLSVLIRAIIKLIIKPLDTMCVAYLSSMKLCGLGNNTSTTFSCRLNHVILAPHGHVENRLEIWLIFFTCVIEVTCQTYCLKISFEYIDN